MVGVISRLPGLICEVGMCFVRASHSEDVIEIPNNSSLRHERRTIGIVLCQRHNQQFQRDGLVGTITAHGDEIVEPVR